MKKLMIGLLISGAALMAQGTAPATSTTPAPTTKVKKHHKKAKPVAASTSATPHASTNAAAPATK